MDAALKENIVNSVKIALEEDIGSGDITALLVPEDAVAEAVIISRESAVICGIPWVKEVFNQLDPGITLDWTVADGGDISESQTLCRLKGNSRHLLTGERTALNFLQTLSGTATTSREYANLVANSTVQILDTRKTIPGMRLAQKYAVQVGGCGNHRMGLYDAFLIKENHIAACGGINNAIERARRIAPEKPVEIEVETLDEFEQALAAKADRIMLDNFSRENIKAASLSHSPHQVELEVSGNVGQHSLDQYSDLAIDFISTGALTKHCRSIDYSMRLKVL
ncbi:MAG: carboxylating nicotinate-nucleotide diphosphorylase [Porticoccaceae bacterium]|nr:carboxylating nicotinate-nucleotide diphosphorylase [Porticoccaceae bacterium]